MSLFLQMSHCAVQLLQRIQLFAIFEWDALGQSEDGMSHEKNFAN